MTDNYTSTHEDKPGKMKDTTSGTYFIPSRVACKAAILPHIFERVFDTQSSELVQTLLERSLSGIACDFYDNTPCVELETVRHVARTAQHTNKLALFFLLLNVDTTLKEYLLTSEDPVRRSKIVRFYLDLKQHVVLRFVGSDLMTPTNFVNLCQEFYRLA